MKHYWYGLLMLFSMGFAWGGEVWHAHRVGAPVFSAPPLARDMTSFVLDFTLPNVVAQRQRAVSSTSELGVKLEDDRMLYPTWGAPEVPGLRCLLQVPEQGAVQIVLEEADYITLTDKAIGPYQPPKPIGCEMRLPHCLDHAIYNNNAFYPSEEVLLEQCALVGGLRLGMVRINPVRYNPISREVRLLTKGRLRMTMFPQIKGQNESLLADPALSREWLPFYQSLPNFNGAACAPRRSTPGCYLFMGSEKNLVAVSDLMAWKRQKGYVVKTAVPGKDGVPLTAEAIDQWIETAYTTWNPKPEYILLVGGEHTMPSRIRYFHLFMHSFGADNDYAVIGDSDFPTLSVGRLTANGNQQEDDPAVLKYMAWKILQHEQGVNEGPWREKALAFGCHSQNDNDGVGLAIQKRWTAAIGQQLNVTKGSDKETPEGGPLMNADQFIQALNQGQSLVTYIGHGSPTDWSNLKFGVGKMGRVQNGTQCPFIFSLACLSGAWYQGYCLYEALMSHGSLAEPKGTVGVYGYSTYSSDHQDGIISHALENIFTKKMHKIGPACVAAKPFAKSLYDVHSGTIFGCPEIDIPTRHPLGRLDVTYHSTQTGQWEVSVQEQGQPVENAMVGLSSPDHTLWVGSGLTDHKGNVPLTLKPGAVPTTYCLTVTAHNCKPSVQSVTW